MNKVMYRESARLYLRPFAEEDLPAMLRWINDPEVSKGLNRCHPLSMEAEREWFKDMNLNLDKEPVLGVVLKGDDHLIGSMGLHRINARDRTAVTGTVLGEKEHWGQGYAPEAKMLFLDIAFRSFNLRKVKSTIWSFNERSVRYNKKCGYREEGRLEREGFIDGEYRDQILLSVFREDWLPLWEEFVESGKQFPRKE